MKRISARAIIIEGDKIGLMYRKKVNHAFYCLPGGKQETGENWKKQWFVKSRKNLELTLKLSKGV